MASPAGCVVSTWLKHGAAEGIIPTDYFDRAEYLKLYPDVAAAGVDPFMHYLEYGRFEHRAPSRKLEGLVRSMAAYSGKDKDPLWRALALLQRKLGRLKSPKIKELISRAAAIEPMIMRPRSMGTVSWAPLVHPRLPLVHVGRMIRTSLSQSHYDRIVLIPHCRTAGSARVAGQLMQHLQALDPTKSLLLVLTDGSFFEHADWFGSGYDRFDLAAILQQIEKSHHVQLLVDLIRGLRPEMIFNVNSRLAWDLTTSYGKQLATETKLFAYLFTWDLDESGNKGGYPIEFFELGFDHLTRVLVDNAALKNELTTRYVMSGKLQDKLRVLYTPMADAQSNNSENFSKRRAAGLPLRCFWSGRFDRQKRFDLVIEIARRRPDLEICAWGKSVLGDPSLDMENLPSNIKLMGTYRDFDELPIRSFDFFLYTSEWDGMPTILVDCGSRGIPVLASRVGGVGEIIDESTGWPIDDALNPAAYVEG